MAAPSTSAETTLSVDEVTDRLRNLSASDQLRFIKASNYLSFGAARPAADLRQEAIRRAIAGTRKCPRHVPIVEFLRGVMRSIASIDRRAIDRAPKLVLVPSDDSATGQLGVDPRLVQFCSQPSSTRTPATIFDDTKRYVDGAATLSAADKQKIFEGNALKVYPRLKAQIDKQARGNA